MGVDFLAPEFIISSGAGGAAVWVAVRTHLQFIWRDLDRVREEQESQRRQLAALEKKIGGFCAGKN